MLDPRTVANSYVRMLLGTVEARGISAQELLRGAHIDPARLDAPNGRIGVEDVRRIWDQALALTGDPMLGLRMAEAVKPNAFRALGHAAMSCDSLRATLQLMFRYHRLVSESGTLSAQTHDNGDVSIVYTEQLLRLRLLPQQVEAIVGGLLSFARWLAERRILPRSVGFQHAAQGQAETYREFFDCAPEFGATANVLRIAAADLDARLPQGDAELCRMHCELLDRQLAELPQVGFVTAFAKQWLSSQISGEVGVEDLARAMGMSVRSLQRQLRAEGSHWTGMVDESRREALVVLLQQQVSLEEAAQRLGYHDASSLSRAARRWFGQTPGQWRSAVK